MPIFFGATIRQYGFMLDGLQQVEKELKVTQCTDSLAVFMTIFKEKSIPFVLLQGDAVKTIPAFLQDVKVVLQMILLIVKLLTPCFAFVLQAGLLVTDFSPLRIARDWKDKIAKTIQQQIPGLPLS